MFYLVSGSIFCVHFVYMFHVSTRVWLPQQQQYTSILAALVANKKLNTHE